MFFWDIVSQYCSVSMGGNSVCEYFYDDNDFIFMVEDIEGLEICNIYNMMKFSKMLFFCMGDVCYLDFYECVMYNYILFSQYLQYGGLVYFMFMCLGYYCMYFLVYDFMWCCVGLGIENYSKYGELVFIYLNDELWVNLFMLVLLYWLEIGVIVIQ